MNLLSSTVFFFRRTTHQNHDKNEYHSRKKQINLYSLKLQLIYYIKIWIYMENDNCKLYVIFFFEKFAKLGKKKRNSRPYKPFPFENVIILF